MHHAGENRQLQSATGVVPELLLGHWVALHRTRLSCCSRCRYQLPVQLITVTMALQLVEPLLAATEQADPATDAALSVAGVCGMTRRLLPHPATAAWPAAGAAEAAAMVTRRPTFCAHCWRTWQA
jgi:hypothetical protein